MANRLLTLKSQAKKIIQRSWNTFYIKANKPDTLLALSLWRLDLEWKLVRLKLVKDVYSINPLKVLHKFKQYLSTFYATEGVFFLAQAKKVLVEVPLPSITNAQKARLDCPITVYKVLQVIKAVSSNQLHSPQWSLSKNFLLSIECYENTTKSLALALRRPYC